MHMIEYIARRTLSPIAKFKKLLSILDKIDIKVCDNTIYLKVDGALVLTTDSDMLLHSTNGQLVTKHKCTHINPNIVINIKDDIGSITDRASQAARVEHRRVMFNRLLEQKRVYSHS